MELIPIKSHAANATVIGSEIVVKAIIKNWLNRYGPFDELLSDRGSQFTSQIIGELERTTAFKQKWTTSYHPECNGLLENKHRWIKQRIHLLSNEHGNDWSDLIGNICYGYNSSRC
eukprot:258681_1